MERPVERAKNWQIGRFWITGDFTGEPAVATRVRIASQDGKPDLTLAEAKQIVASVGLIASKPDPDDPEMIHELPSPLDACVLPRVEPRAELPLALR